MAWVTKSSEESYTPEPAPREYTRQEKAANWWHYHKFTVLAVVIVLGLAGWLLHDMFGRVRPDLEIGYVGTQALPAGTVEALQDALVPYVTDRNGDGRVVVQLNQYRVDLSTGETADPSAQLAGTTQLTAALTEGSDTYLFLLEDPADFEAQTQVLQYTDGTLPGADQLTDWQRMVYRWADCPVLAGLALESDGETAGPETAPGGQDLLAGLYIGCRGNWAEEAPEAYTASTALWAVLTAGAAPVEG